MLIIEHELSCVSVYSPGYDRLLTLPSQKNCVNTMLMNNTYLYIQVTWSAGSGASLPDTRHYVILLTCRSDSSQVNH